MRLKAVVQRELTDFDETWNPHTCVRRLRRLVTYSQVFGLMIIL